MFSKRRVNMSDNIVTTAAVFKCFGTVLILFHFGVLWDGSYIICENILLEADIIYFVILHKYWTGLHIRFSLTPYMESWTPIWLLGLPKCQRNAWF